MIHDRERGANKHYPTATIDVIKSLKPPVAEDSILLIWTISSHLPETLAVISAWGFKYKTKAWTWVKMTNDLSRPRMGMGYWTRQCTEDCLLATRGNPSAPEFRAELALIQAPREEHSKKPDEQYNKIDRLFPNLSPKLEMFARNQRKGWDVFGNEVKNSINLGDPRVSEQL